VPVRIVMNAGIGVVVYPAASTSRLSPMRPKILIVDDEPVTRELFKGLLQPLEADVVEAHDGYEALAAVRRHYFSLVLLDISMPGLSGHQVAAALRRDPHTSALPIIFVTATRPEGGSTPEQAPGLADLLLTKPVEPAMLRALVRLLLRLYVAQRNAVQEVQFLRNEVRDLRARGAVLGPVDRS
jgi:putative two-component system response regulator